MSTQMLAKEVEDTINLRRKSLTSIFPDDYITSSMATPPFVSGDEPIEGIWDTFRIKIAREEDVPAILENIRVHYCRDNVLCHCLQDDPSLLVEGVLERAKFYMQESQGHSLVAYDLASGELAGVRIACVKYKEDVLDAPPEEFGEFGQYSLVLEMMDQLGRKIKPNVFEAFGVDKLVEFHFLSVASQFRERYLGYEMSLRCLRLCKSNDIKLVKVCYSSDFSRRIGKKLGFVLYDQIKYATYEKDGKVIFGNMKPPHEYAVLMFKIL